MPASLSLEWLLARGNKISILAFEVAKELWGEGKGGLVEEEEEELRLVLNEGSGSSDGYGVAM
ncbi:hypothetical protein PIB30_105739, partial [Stylosanthes scabra]|nr:hypothetical protein [Stylosanthes scabra]